MKNPMFEKVPNILGLPREPRLSLVSHGYEFIKTWVPKGALGYLAPFKHREISWCTFTFPHSHLISL